MTEFIPLLVAALVLVLTALYAIVVRRNIRQERTALNMDKQMAQYRATKRTTAV